MVKPEINSAADLKGKTLASPQLGGTQDVALRAWLGKQGYKTNTDGSGDVAINPTENAQTLKLFQDGKLDGAWLPEPWASRLVLQAGAKVLVDEKDLWDEGRVPHHHPDREQEVRRRAPGDRQGAARRATWNPWTGSTPPPPPRRPPSSTPRSRKPPASRLPADVIDRSLKNIAFTVDPLAGTYQKLLQDGVDAGTTKQADINGIFDLTALNSVLGEGTTGRRSPRRDWARTSRFLHHPPTEVRT